MDASYFETECGKEKDKETRMNPVPSLSTATARQLSKQRHQRGSQGSAVSVGDTEEGENMGGPERSGK